MNCSLHTARFSPDCLVCRKWEKNQQLPWRPHFSSFCLCQWLSSLLKGWVRCTGTTSGHLCHEQHDKKLALSAFFVRHCCKMNPANKCEINLQQVTLNSALSTCILFSTILWWVFLFPGSTGDRSGKGKEYLIVTGQKFMQLGVWPQLCCRNMWCRGGRYTTPTARGVVWPCSTTSIIALTCAHEGLFSLTLEFLCWRVKPAIDCQWNPVQKLLHTFRFNPSIQRHPKIVTKRPAKMKQLRVWCFFPAFRNTVERSQWYQQTFSQNSWQIVIVFFFFLRLKKHRRTSPFSLIRGYNWSVQQRWCQMAHWSSMLFNEQLFLCFDLFHRCSSVAEERKQQETFNLSQNKKEVFAFSFPKNKQ